MGVLYLANALEQHGFSVDLHESSEDNGTFLRRLTNSDPLYVGFSVHTWPSIIDMVDKSKLVKRSMAAPVVWGGIHPSVLPEETIAEDFVDYIVTGDGERAAVRIAQEIADGSPPLDPVIVGGVERNLDEFRPSFGHLRLSEYLYESNHSVRGNSKGQASSSRIFYYLMTSRGCPYNCTFCYNSASPKIPWRSHSAEWIIEEVKMLQRFLNVDGVGFWDDYFLGDMKRAEAVFKYFRDNNISFLCEARAKDLTVDFARYLKESGCLQVFVGAESGSDRILDKLNKKSTVSHLFQAAEAAQAVSLPLRMSFIYGFPSERFEDLVNTKKVITRLNAYSHVSISGPKLLSVYPGTAIYNEAVDAGFQPPETIEGWSQITRSSNLRFLPWLERLLEKNNSSLSFLYDV